MWKTRGFAAALSRCHPMRIPFPFNEVKTLYNRFATPTGLIASADNPAVAGEAASMYTTSLTDGSVIAPQVIVGGRLAQVLYYGPLPVIPVTTQGELRCAGRRCARGAGFSALDLSQPA